MKIQKDELANWKQDPVTQYVLGEFQKKVDFLKECLADGGLFNSSNMEYTFALTAKTIGKIEMARDFFEITEEGESDED